MLLEELKPEESDLRLYLQSGQREVDLGLEFRDMVLEVEAICKPRMLQHDAGVRERKLERLKMSMAVKI